MASKSRCSPTASSMPWACLKTPLTPFGLLIGAREAPLLMPEISQWSLLRSVSSFDTRANTKKKKNISRNLFYKALLLEMKALSVKALFA